MYNLSFTDKSFSINGDTYQRGDILQLRGNQDGNIYIRLKYSGREYNGHFSEFTNGGVPFATQSACVTFIKTNFFFIGGSGTGGGGGTPSDTLLFLVDNNILKYKWGTNGSLTEAISLLSLNAKMSYVNRIALTGVADGTLVYQTDRAKGQYMYRDGAWHFISTKTIKIINTQYYTLTTEDIAYIILSDFDMPSVPVEVTIPTGFKINQTVDFIQAKSSKIKFITATGVTSVFPASAPLKRTCEIAAKAQIIFRANDNCIATGGLE